MITLIKCPVCMLEFKNKQALSMHTRHHHKEYHKNYIESVKNPKYENLLPSGNLKCPICEQEFSSLMKHIVNTHKVGYAEARRLYPNCKFHVNKEKNHDLYTCSECGKSFKKTNGLSIHLKYTHNIYKEHKEEQKEKAFICKVCKKPVNLLSQHVWQSHLMEWEQYCLLYGHDNSKKGMLSDSHKLALSKQKLEFFNCTDRGKELRQIYSKNMSVNNISVHPNARNKISLSAARRSSDVDIESPTMRGYLFKLCIADSPIVCRSLEEFKVYFTLRHHKIQFLINDFSRRIPYTTPEGLVKTYLRDFVLNDDFIVEIKTNLTGNSFSIEYENKYSLVEKQNSIKLNFFTYNTLCEYLGISPFTTSYILSQINSLFASNELTKIYCPKRRTLHIGDKIAHNHVIDAIDIKYLEAGKVII